MIETTPSDIEDISFFEAFAQVVRKSGLRPPEIARRANNRIAERIAAITDPVDRMLEDIATPRLYRQTVARAIIGETSVSKEVLARIALGLELDAETYIRLEKLREAEPHVHHSTKGRAVVNAQGKTDSPSWFQ